MRALKAKLVGGIGVALLALLPVGIAARAARTELVSDFRPTPHRLGHPASLDLVDVAFRAGDAEIRGWIHAPGEGAAVVLLHGAGADRASMLPEASLLARHGFAVLLYDSPGHGESSGRVTWDEGERAALRAALDRLSIEPGVDPHRLGVLGFSMGSIIALQVAAGEPRVRGVVVTGAIPDFAELLRWQFRGRGPLTSWPAVEAARWAGMDLDHRRPIDLIASIAPRPVLLVAGSDDHTVPPAMTRELFDAAREPKALLVVPGGHHGHYDEVAGARYEQRLVSFFDEALAP